jgi:8-hydroxy-5-deazaflavin:NADPH oxidoreductase
MKIGIIGAGQIGGTLTRRFTALGHVVFVANSRGPETLSDLAAETGATAVSVPESVRGVDLVVVTIPEKNIPNLPAGLFADTPDRVVVVDTGNYYPRQRDGRIEAIEAGLPESKWVAQQLGRPVIKAFNNIYAKHLLELGQPKGTPGRIALPVSGDDDAAKTIVLKLIDELGFDAVDAGGGMNPGGNSQARQFIPRTSMPMVCGVLWLRPPKIGPQNGAPPTIAPVASPRPREAY